MELWLTAKGSRTRLVVEERGLPLTQVNLYGSGWQAHREDLGRSLSSGTAAHADDWSGPEARAAWRERWTPLTPNDQNATAG